MPRLSRDVYAYIHLILTNSPLAEHLLGSAATSSMDRLRMLAAHLNADTCAGEYCCIDREPSW